MNADGNPSGSGVNVIAAERTLMFRGKDAVLIQRQRLRGITVPRLTESKTELSISAIVFISELPVVNFKVSGFTDGNAAVPDPVRLPADHLLQ